MTRLAVEGMRAPKLAVVLVLACLAIPCGSVRLKIPKSLCGRYGFLPSLLSLLCLFFLCKGVCVVMGINGVHSQDSVPVHL